MFLQWFLAFVFQQATVVGLNKKVMTIYVCSTCIVNHWCEANMWDSCCQWSTETWSKSLIYTGTLQASDTCHTKLCPHKLPLTVCYEKSEINTQMFYQSVYRRCMKVKWAMVIAAVRRRAENQDLSLLGIRSRMDGGLFIPDKHTFSENMLLTSTKEMCAGFDESLECCPMFAICLVCVLA